MEILIEALHSPLNQLSGQEWAALGTLAWLFGLVGWSFGDYRGYSRGWKNGKDFVEACRPYSSCHECNSDKRCADPTCRTNK